MSGGAAFLPLAIGALDAGPPSPLGPVADAARRVERDARAAWAGLLGDPAGPVPGDLSFGLRRLSLAVSGFVGVRWWNEDGRAHRDRVTDYQLWLEEALAERDGAGFARAFAGYDEAVARVLGARPAGARAPRTRNGRRGAPGHPSGRAAEVIGEPSGTMARWARQASAVTSRMTTPRRPGGWTTSRHGTSSSRWSRRSRSAG